jgi:hypothetical protein
MNENDVPALRVFSVAREFVASAGPVGEVGWQTSRHYAAFTESDLLRESAWVILCSGFREFVVRKKFDHISLCFCDWESSEAIVNTAWLCQFSASASIGNRRKLAAITEVAHHIHTRSFPEVKRRIIANPIEYLQVLPYIGPITSWHLAKNLGFDVAKPDRHLTRLAKFLGYKDAHVLCASIAAMCKLPIMVVDIVLWRYLASGPGLDALRESVSNSSEPCAALDGTTT